MKKLLGIVVLGLLWCSVSFSHEAPKTTEAKQDYIKNYLVLFEIEATNCNFGGDEKTPCLRYAIKNIGSETLKKIEVIVYFLDKNGKAFFEKKYHPISIYSIDGVLKPNYTYRRNKDTYMSIENLGDEWSGKVKIEIVDIEFAE
ncbi:MAG: hypothetical protein H8E55_08285 [Pelagibacterales bacterium]|nr:hypothetical protein [Pelagibacterales bacterium]